MAEDRAWFLSKLVEDEVAQSKRLVIDADRRIDSEELAKINASLQLITEITEGSPYRELDERYKAFKESIVEVATALRGQNNSPDDLRRISRTLDDFLSAFRGFDDRTSHNLSKRYGDKSEQFLRFKEALSHEFDHVFEYRFAWQLRNYGQHAGSPITNLRASARLENNQVISICDPVFDSRKLLESYKKWTAKVRPDLERIQGEFSVEETIDVVMKSCVRAFLKYIYSQEKEISSAIDTVEGYAANLEVNEHPILIEMKKEPKTPEDMRSVIIKYIRTDLAKLAKGLLDQAKMESR